MESSNANINEEFVDSSVKPTLTVPVTIGPDGKPTVDDKFFENNEEFKNFAKNVNNESVNNLSESQNNPYQGMTPEEFDIHQKTVFNSMGRPVPANGGKSKKARKAKKSKGGKSKKARKSLRRK
jgi:hypothetical protein